MTIDHSHLRALLAAASPVPFDDEGSARIIDRDGSLVATATGETRELRGRNRDLLVGAVNALESLLDVYEAACAARDLSRMLDDTKPHEERERYLDLHERWIAATNAVDAAVDKARGK